MAVVGRLRLLLRAWSQVGHKMCYVLRHFFWRCPMPSQWYKNFAPCRSCGSTSPECNPGCLCIKCIDPAIYAKFKANTPAYDAWRKAQNETALRRKLRCLLQALWLGIQKDSELTSYCLHRAAHEEAQQSSGSLEKWLYEARQLDAQYKEEGAYD
jgi:hypothetical protein